ncbi:MAG: hemerythrin family protein [Candidatus Zixiibacteriota bacterium]
MSLITWKKSLVLDIDDIDRQHKDLAMTINKIFMANDLGKSDSTCLRLLKEFQSQIKSHFEFENEYVKNLEFESINAQVNIYNEFLEKLARLISTYTTCEDVVRRNLVLFLANWLTEHIKIDKVKFNIARKKQITITNRKGGAL